MVKILAEGIKAAEAVATAQQAASPVSRPKAPRLPANRINPADFTVRRMAITPLSGTTLKDLFHPEYFGNVLNTLKPGTEISVLSDDMALDCKLRVLSVTHTTVSLRLLDFYAGDKPEGFDKQTIHPDDVKVDHGGPQKWRVLHNGDIVKFDFATKEDAEAFRRQYLKEQE